MSLFKIAEMSGKIRYLPRLGFTLTGKIQFRPVTLSSLRSFLSLQDGRIGKFCLNSGNFCNPCKPILVKNKSKTKASPFSIVAKNNFKNPKDSEEDFLDLLSVSQSRYGLHSDYPEDTPSFGRVKSH